MEESIFNCKEYLFLGGPADGSWVRLPLPPPAYYLHTEPPPFSAAEMREAGDATTAVMPDTWEYTPVTLREGRAEYTVFVCKSPATRVLEKLIYGYHQHK